MPNGIPVATVALNGAKNAGILAARILGAYNPTIREKLSHYAEEMKQAVLDSGKSL
jgi:5-(carboxyamino)imidazole ribonucleotide mutase